ncbi:MAG: hypothetical protein WAM28_04960 [Chlamydiales bacterium]
MKIFTDRIHIKTVADGGVHDLTDLVEEKLKETQLQVGTVTLSI